MQAIIEADQNRLIWNSDASFVNNSIGEPCFDRLNNVFHSIHKNYKNFNQNQTLDQNIEKKMLKTLKEESLTMQNLNLHNKNNIDSKCNINRFKSKHNNKKFEELSLFDTNENKYNNNNENIDIEERRKQKVERALKILHAMTKQKSNIPKHMKKRMLKSYLQGNLSVILKLHNLKNNIKANYNISTQYWQIFQPIGPGFFTCMHGRFFQSFGYNTGSAIGAVIFNRMLFFLENMGLFVFYDICVSSLHLIFVGIELMHVCVFLISSNVCSSLFAKKQS